MHRKTTNIDQGKDRNGRSEENERNLFPNFEFKSTLENVIDGEKIVMRQINILPHISETILARDEHV